MSVTLRTRTRRSGSVLVVRNGFRLIVCVDAIYFHAQVGIHGAAGLRDQERRLQQLGKPLRSHSLVLHDVKLPTCKLSFELRFAKALQHYLHQSGYHRVAFRLATLHLEQS